MIARPEDLAGEFDDAAGDEIILVEDREFASDGPMEVFYDAHNEPYMFAVEQGGDRFVVSLGNYEGAKYETPHFLRIGTHSKGPQRDNDPEDAAMIVLALEVSLFSPDEQVEVAGPIERIKRAAEALGADQDPSWPYGKGEDPQPN